MWFPLTKQEPAPASRTKGWLPIVVGVDDRSASRDALALGKQLAIATGADLHLASVLEYRPAPLPLAPYERARGEHFDEIFERLEPLVSRLPHTNHRVNGSLPWRSLDELAEELEASLIVVGSSRRGLAGRILPGATGDRLLSEGPAVVAIAPRGYAEQRRPIRRIGVGFDGDEGSDECSEAALVLAGRLATVFGASLQVIGVEEPPRSTVDRLVSMMDVEQERSKEFRLRLANAAATLEGIDTDVVVLDGEAAEALADAGSKLDLVVTGSHGYGPIRRLLFGSVSSRLAHIAETPLIVVGAPSAAAGR